MNDVAELKEFAAVHARAQQIPRERYASVLDRISHDGAGTGSWAEEWSREARRSAADGDPLGAVRLFTMARFPFVDGAPRQHALEQAVAGFDGWRTAAGTDLQKIEVPVLGSTVRCWGTGFPAGRDTAAGAPPSRSGKPFVVMMGGIVSTKEQWAPTLLRLRRFGVAGVAAEMPRTGVNPLRYDADSHRMLSGILDAVADRVDVAHSYAMTWSFAGHMALRCALDDRRIRGVLTVGAPISRVFTDPGWQRRLPRVTVDTLAHLTGTGTGEVGAHLRGWALTPRQLDRLDIPVAYVASRRDEIIPADDVGLLRRHVRRLDVIEHDDVHGSPHHVEATGLWLVRSLLRMHGSHAHVRAALGAALPALRLRRALSHLTSRPAAAPLAAAPTGATPVDGAAR